MTAFEEIATQIQQLSPADLARFREWFAEYSWQAWDTQIELDSKSVKLKALADHAAGKTERL